MLLVAVLDKIWYAYTNTGKITLHATFNMGELIWARSTDVPCVTNFPKKHWEKRSPWSYCNISVLFIFPVVKHYIFIKPFEAYIK